MWLPYPTSMGKSQPTYTKEFKQQAVNLFETSEKTKTQITRDLGISDSALNQWCKQFGERGEEAFPGKGHQTPLEEENRKLRREVEVLRIDRGNSKKSYEHLHAAPFVKYQFIHENRFIYPITRMCSVIEVSENGYYNWRKRGKSQRKQDDEQLVSRIEDAYHENRGVYGSPRIHAELKAQGIRCGRKRIARLMREHNISAMRKRRQAKKTDSNHSSPIAPNLLERDFEASAPNQKWLTDMTFIATEEGWLYLAGVLDAYSRKLVGWAMGQNHDAELVKQALDMALVMRQLGAGLVHHGRQRQ